jgi:hypothetical protein
MDGWLIVFILLCIVYGPIYVISMVAAFALSTFDNGATDYQMRARLLLMAVVLGSPFIFAGYMAFRRK